MIKNGIKLNQLSFYKTTALMIASSKGYIDFVRLLIEQTNKSKKSLNIKLNLKDNNGHTALLIALHNKHFEICKLLILNPLINLNLKISYGYTYLIYFSIYHLNENGIELIKLLVDRGADIWITTKYKRVQNALYYLYDKNNIDILEYLLQSNQGFNKIKKLRRKNINFNQIINL